MSIQDATIEILETKIGNLTLLAEKHEKNMDEFATLNGYSSVWNSLDTLFQMLTIMPGKQGLAIQAKQERDSISPKIQSLQKIVQKRVTQSRGRGGGGGTSGADDDIDCSIVKAVNMGGTSCITFNDVIGLENVKETLRSTFLDPILWKGLWPAKKRAILLYGLPGVGKTYIVRAAINELNTAAARVIFYAPTGAELKGKYVGETEKRIASYFKCASDQASRCSDAGTQYLSVIFIDEIEAIGGDRNQDNTGLMTNSVNMLLQKIDGVVKNENVAVIAATNYPWKLDSALLRRFSQQIRLTLPTVNDIFVILVQQLRKYLDIPKPKIPGEDDVDENEDLKMDDDMICHQKPCRQERLAFSINIFEVYDIDASVIKEYAERLRVEKFSNSDVVRFITKTLSLAAQAARDHGVFKKAKFLNQNKTGYFSTLHIGKGLKEIPRSHAGSHTIRINHVNHQAIKYNGVVMKNVALFVETEPKLIHSWVDIFVDNQFEVQMKEYQRIKKNIEKSRIPAWAQFYNQLPNTQFPIMYRLRVKFRNQEDSADYLYGLTSISFRRLYRDINVPITNRAIHGYFGTNMSLNPFIYVFWQTTRLFLKRNEGPMYTIGANAAFIRWKLVEIYAYSDFSSTVPTFELDRSKLQITKQDQSLVVADLINLGKMPDFSFKVTGFEEQLGLTETKKLREKVPYSKMRSESGDEVWYIGDYVARRDIMAQKITHLQISQSLKTCHLSKTFFEEAKRLTKSSIRDRDKKYIDAYYDNPRTFNIADYQTKKEE